MKILSLLFVDWYKSLASPSKIKSHSLGRWEKSALYEFALFDEMFSTKKWVQFLGTKMQNKNKMVIWQYAERKVSDNIQRGKGQTHR